MHEGCCEDADKILDLCVCLWVLLQLRLHCKCRWHQQARRQSTRGRAVGTVPFDACLKGNKTICMNQLDQLAAVPPLQTCHPSLRNRCSPEVHSLIPQCAAVLFIQHSKILHSLVAWSSWASGVNCSCCSWCVAMRWLGSRHMQIADQRASHECFALVQP